jgi:hypothetical protein
MANPLTTSDIWLPVNTQPASTATRRWEMARQKPRGHFKIGGPLVAAFELIAYRFGSEILHLPIPETCYYTYSDPAGSQIGALSLEAEAHWGSWAEFEAVPFFNASDHLGTCRRLLSNLQAIRDVVVFDIWIRNTDRHLWNILVNEREDERHYDVVFIDHSHSLLGPGRSYEAAFLTQPGPRPQDYLRAEEVALAGWAVTDFAQAEDAVARIQQLPDDEIEATVDEVAGLGLLAGDERDAIITGLKFRRDELEQRARELLP